MGKISIWVAHYITLTPNKCYLGIQETNNMQLHPCGVIGKHNHCEHRGSQLNHFCSWAFCVEIRSHLEGEHIHHAKPRNEAV